MDRVVNPSTEDTLAANRAARTLLPVAGERQQAYPLDDIHIPPQHVGLGLNMYDVQSDDEDSNDSEEDIVPVNRTAENSVFLHAANRVEQCEPPSQELPTVMQPSVAAQVEREPPSLLTAGHMDSPGGPGSMQDVPPGDTGSKDVPSGDAHTPHDILTNGTHTQRTIPSNTHVDNVFPYNFATDLASPETQKEWKSSKRLEAVTEEEKVSTMTSDSLPKADAPFASAPTIPLQSMVEEQKFLNPQDPVSGDAENSLSSQFNAESPSPTVVSHIYPTPKPQRPRRAEARARNSRSGSEIDAGPKLDAAYHYLSKESLGGMKDQPIISPQFPPENPSHPYTLKSPHREDSSSANDRYDNFYRALSRIQEQAGANEGSDQDQIQEILAQARALLHSPQNSPVASPMFGSGSRATLAKDPKHWEKKSFDFEVGTSASTPEGALGRLALTSADTEEESLPNYYRLDDDLEEVVATAKPDHGSPKIRGISSRPLTKPSELHALRAALRFTLQCYDDLQRQKKEQATLSDAMVASVIRNRLSSTSSEMSQTSTFPEKESIMTRSADLDRNNSRARSRLRSGSILRSLTSRSKNVTSGDTGKSLLGINGSGQAQPFAQSRKILMDMDTPWEDVARPTNRFGLSHGNATPQPDSESSSRVRAPSTSTAFSSDLGDPELQQSSSAKLASLQHQNRHLIEERERMQTEMEDLSRSLFSEANELVKAERIKSSSLEKELESLKNAISQQQGSESHIHSKEDSLSGHFDDGAKDDCEAAMMAAVAQASRECAEAEEESAELRSQMEDLQGRIAILEDALYTSMTHLAQHDNRDPSQPVALMEKLIEDDEQRSMQQPVDGLDRQDIAVDKPNGVFSNGEFSESSSSFYSVAEGQESPAENSSKGVRDSGASNIELYPPADEDALEDNHASRSEAHDLVELKKSNASVGGRSESDMSGSSNRSSSIHSAQGIQRSSSKSSKRHSLLPPRLPQPVSPLPDVPGEDDRSKQRPESATSHSLFAAISSPREDDQESKSFPHGKRPVIQPIKENKELPSLSVAGSLAAASPMLPDTFSTQGWPKYQREPSTASRTDKIMPSRSVRSMSSDMRTESAASINANANVGLSRQTFLSRNLKDEQSISGGGSVSTSRRSSTADSIPRRKKQDKQNRKLGKSAILGHMPPTVPSATISPSASRDSIHSRQSSASFTTGHSQGRPSSIQEYDHDHDANSMNSDNQHSNPTLEHYARLQQSPVQYNAKSAANFSRRRYFRSENHPQNSPNVH